ncbi:hypothetical protein Q31b_33110 [Novipirellula aureliae]|uniref:Polymerase/histidinol phosphatase N-terminal domain-containing protein n=2 Tax=Novipirellula aureliae TaxID=2527966 RepID=A0A5C6DUL3_9BACT|nr:hypothetical protein Q31b_33110 [Novipirellula aureliae]
MTEIIGSRWWKFDFHTHTPFSTDTPWHSLAGADELSPSAWLRKYMEAKIDCIAVTDHNGAGWVDKLAAEYRKLEENPPEWFRSLTLFPGVEISVNQGFHILGIFSPLTTTDSIHELLAVCGYMGLKGDPQVRTEKSCQDVVKIIRDRGGICIPAHVDIDNGLFAASETGQVSGDSQTIRQIWECNCFDAVEIRDPNWQPPGLWNDLRSELAVVVGSDCHNFRGERLPGQHFTWVKMGEPSFEGLQLALHDGNGTSIVRGETDADPNAHATPIIESVAINNLKLMGRSSGAMTTPLSPWLTALIGGRGSGKSTIIDSLRILFDRVGDLPKDMQSEFAEFQRIAPEKDKRGLLLEDTSISAIVLKNAARFRLTWTTTSGETKIERETAPDVWELDDGDVRQRFRVRVLSQKEVYEISRDPHALTNLIDQSEGLRLNDWREKRSQLHAKFKRLRNDQRELDSKIQPKQRLLGELGDVNIQLKVFEEGDNRQVLLDYQRRGRQERILDDQIEDVGRLEESIRGLVEEVAPNDFDEEQFDRDVQSDASAVKLIEEAVAKQQAAAASLRAIADDLQAFAIQWRSELSSTAWATTKKRVDERYEAVVSELTEAGVQDPNQYRKLVQQRALIEGELKQIGESEKRLAEIQVESRDCLREIAGHRREISQRRIEFLRDTLADNQFVRASVVPFGATADACETEFRRRVGCDQGFERDILGNENYTGAIGHLFTALPTEQEERSRVLDERLFELKSGVEEMAVGGDSKEYCTQSFAKRMAKLSPEQLDNVLLWFPDDVLKVEYCHDRSRNRWMPIEQGSPGQRSAAILAFLLSNETCPILLDQPEDDLDNHLIYDLIVQQIREKKSQRQIITATHNPNIVVNGDAELVLAMDATTGQCRVHPQRSGSLQEPRVRAEVCDVMEGGRQAFQKRYKRIMLPAPSNGGRHV